MKPHLLEQDQANIEFLYQLIFRNDFFPGGRIATVVISAIDIALWDIKGKAL
jgi:galactonate dehydratase